MILLLVFTCVLALCQACHKSDDCPSGQKCMASNCVLDIKCPAAQKFGTGPPASCQGPSDPQKRPKSGIESWFTQEVYNDLFPKSNIGWGPNKCWPYSYESFIIAARYFPRFGTESPNNVYSAQENHRRDLAAFFAHVIQETGENNPNLYNVFHEKEKADACFYRGGFYNWFEGGPTSAFLDPAHPGHHPADGDKCQAAGKYCMSSAMLNYWFPCSKDKVGQFFKGCYFGRGAIQISYNFNYGQFQIWLKSQGINIDLLSNPNLVMTKMDPPLTVMASIWFYMTPQPPKPAMHDIVMGQWEPGKKNKAAGYKGPIFGPTSLVINNECGGEDLKDPGGPGESRRIKAFKWFTNYFGVPAGPARLLTCKNMPQRLSDIRQPKSYQPDWSTTWKDQPCKCVPAYYGGVIPYFKKGFYPDVFVKLNKKNELRCAKSIYDNPDIYGLRGQACLNHPLNGLF